MIEYKVKISKIVKIIDVNLYKMVLNISLNSKNSSMKQLFLLSAVDN